MNKLLELRKANGLRQIDIANHIGVTKQGYSNYEKGLRDPDYVTLQKIADYYGVTVDYILGRDTDELGNVLTPLTDGEKALLDLFNRVPKEQQQLVLDMVAVALKNLK